MEPGSKWFLSVMIVLPDFYMICDMKLSPTTSPCDQWRNDSERTTGKTVVVITML